MEGKAPRALPISALAALIAAMKNRVGKLQRATRRAFIYSDAQPITTADILRHAFPHLTRFEPWRYQDARRAAKKFAVRIGRSECGRGCPVRWIANPELMALIKGE
jgi:hypothetical protein